MPRLTALVVAVVLVLALVPAAAQEYRGSLYLKICTESGQPILEADVTISGVGATRTTRTDGSGQVRFIKLEPGEYAVEVAKDGFNTLVNEGVVVNTTSNTEMEIKLQRAEVVERVVVKARTPLIDKRETGTGTIVSTAEIAKIPTARDPWAVMSTIPGVQTDIVNVGGNESGQQAAFTSKGTLVSSASWVMDGTEVTDVAALGWSSGYYDFNSFNEVGFVTGGAEPEQVSPGLRMNFTTKQGTNRHSGSIGLLLTDHDVQDTPSSPRNPDGTSVRSNEINQVFEKIFELGGPIVSDRAWYWIGFSQNDIELLTPGPNETQIPDDTRLQNVTAKVNAALGNTTLKGFYTDGDKTKRGRGAGPGRAPEATWDQDGGVPIYSFDLSHFFTPNLEISAQYSHVHSGFEVFPQGTAPQVRLDPDFVWQDSYYDYGTDRPQDQYALRGNWFADSGPVSHEVRFGFKYKDCEVSSFTGWAADNVVAAEVFSSAWLMREAAPANAMEYTSAWVGDTILVGDWTINLGAQYIEQEGEQLPSVTPANPLCPQCLPEIRYPGFDPGFRWEDVLPRAGVTYTFDTARRQLLRASASRYVQQLGVDAVAYNHPMRTAEIDYLWNDVDGDKRVDVGEFDAGLPDPVTGVNCIFDPATGAGPIWSGNVDPCNPGEPVVIDSIDPGLEAPRTDELILGYEIELMKDFSLALNYTRRESDRHTWTPLRDLVNGGIIDSSHWEPLAPIGGTVECFDDAVPCEIPEGDGFVVQPYGLADSGVALTDPTRPRILTNRPGLDLHFDGLELVANKRLSNRWMMRGYLAWEEWTREIDCSVTGTTGECVAGPGVQNPKNGLYDTNKDGADVAINASWHLNANGLVQLPKNFSLSANVRFQEGAGIPVFYRTGRIWASDGVSERQALQVLDMNRYRYDDLLMVDLRVSRLMQINDASVDLSLEAFNLFDEDTVLSISGRMDTLGRMNTVVSPRVLRIGARITFD